MTRRNTNAQYFADISTDQREFDAHRYASAGHVVIAMKSTEGDSYSDPDTPERTLAAHDVGLRVIHYHYADMRGGASWQQEAANFVRHTFPRFTAGDRLAIDIEQPGEIGYGGVAAWSRSFAGAVAVHMAQPLIVYCPLSLLTDSVPTLDVPGQEFWIAAWGGYVPRLGGNRVRFAHQFASPDNGPPAMNFAGIGVCDSNILTRRALKSLTV